MFAKLCLLVTVFAFTFAQSEHEQYEQAYKELADYRTRDANIFLQAIVPGTKWCGDGNIASDYNDLGLFKKTDMCCRDHDHCDDDIEAGGSNHGLNNTGLFTRLHCKCDLQFFDCLKAADKMVAHVVGTGYFNILGRQCFNETPPATCVKYEDILGFRERCVEYSYDTSKPAEWQWFDVPRYIDL